jgi:hypothetical protein
MMTNDPLKLDESGEWAGLWWLPETPDERLPGVLRYDGKGGLSLSLIGAFEERIFRHLAPGVKDELEGLRVWDVIYGAAQQREITLLDCVPIRSRRSIGARVESPDTQTVKATTVIIGAHVSGREDTAFEAAEISVEDLMLWAASSVFSAYHCTRNGMPDGTGTISVKPVAAQSVTVNNTEYRLEHTHTLPFWDWSRGKTVGRMRDVVSIRVRWSEPSALKTALEAASLVQDLIALATHRAAGVIWLQLELAGTEALLPDGRMLPPRRADVLYSPVAVGKSDEKAIDPGSVFFTCEMLPFEELMPRWCEVRGKLQAAINMILGLRYAPARFVENNLLMAVGAAEALHRGLYIEEKPIPEAVFKEMRDGMLGQVPEEYRCRFKQAIRNSPTLRDRLLALAARPDQEAIEQLVPDVEHWAKRTTRARNDLAHEGKTPSHSIDELIAIVDTTSAVVILNVLYELGLPAERQREIVQDHPRFRMICRKAREWLVPPENDS